MFYLSYILSELRRRKGRTLLTALGLGVGVGLVVTVTALSNGLDHAQDQVLQPLTGLGTDMSVTRPLKISGGGTVVGTLSARQNVEVALAPTGMKAATRHARARELLERVGLGQRLDNLPSQLSGGEQQRVAIARALANEPEVVLADEPTGNLDTATGEEVMDVLRGLWAQEGLSIVLITHDPSIAATAGRLVRLRDGRVVAPDEVAA